MKTKRLHKLAAALCALALLLSLVPAAYAADAPLQLGDIIGGDPNCKHDFDSFNLIWDEDNNCLEWHYRYWPCKNCDAKYVAYTIAPKQRHRFNPVTGLCIDCGTPDPDPNASYPGRAPATPDTPDTPDTPTTPDNPKPDLPTAPTSEKLYENGQVLGGILECEHIFDNAHPVKVPANCAGFGYLFWPCTRCNAYKVGVTFKPTGHSFNVNGVCTKCGASKPGDKPETPTAPAGSLERNYDFGEYTGVIDTGEMEFVRYLKVGEKETQLPLVNTQGYNIKITSSAPNIVGVDGLTFQAKAEGNAKLYYVFTGSGVEPVKVIVNVTVMADPSSSAGSDIQPNPQFGTYFGKNKDGVDEFKITLTAGTKETGRPMTSTQNYRVNTLSSDAKVVAWDGMTILAKGPGTATLTYKYVINGVEQLKAIVYATVMADPSSSAGSDIQPDPQFGTYVGKNKDGVDEFKITLTAGTKETGRPMTSTQNYRVNTLSSDAKVVAWDGMTILAKGPGTATLTYKYVIDGKEQLKAIVYATVVADPSAAGSDIQPNPQFGTYVGKNKDGVDEFKITLTVGTKETGRPMTSTQNYRINTLSSDAKVVAWDGMTILAKGPGTATLTYKYVIDGKEQLKAIVYATVVADPSVSFGSGAAYSKRAGGLGPRPGGGYDLIWTSGHQTIGMDGKVVSDTRQTKITSYDADFKEIATRPVKFELNTLKGGYWGEKYNYLIFTQNNDEETDGKEVLRLVKYTKDWERLGAASLYGKSSNTSEAVRSANLSFAEAGDMLYVHTAHKIYRLSDGLQHQTNLTFSVRQSDMTVTDGRYGIEQTNRGYCSHSFAQDILVDQSGNIVTLDQGDAYPRAAMLFMYGTKAGGDTFTSAGTYTLLQKWSGGTGDNNTGSRTCALAETSQGYLSAYVDSGKGSGYNSTQDHYNVYLAFNAKNNFTKTQIRQIAAGSASENPFFVYLFPTGPNGGHVLWFSAQKGQYNWMSDYTAYCAAYSADGSVGSATKLTSFTGAPFNGPCYDGSKIVWTDQADEEKGMNFYILENGKLTVAKAGGALAGKPSATEKPSEKPSDATPAGPADPRTPFTDVPAGSYYADAVVWALAKGITNGATATTFAPNATCERGQVATFLWRAKGEPEPGLKVNPFRDVPASSPYYKAILWAYENDIINGTSATTFEPYATCTNGHVVTMLWRAEGKPAASGTSSLAQSFRTDFYTDAVAWADTSGLLKDTGAAFDPDRQSPRSNIVTYLYRNLAEGSTTAPGTTPGASGAKLANGQEITEANVLSIINGLRTEYPEGKRWTNDNSYFSAAVSTQGYGCAGFALICSDAAFGSLPVTETHSDFDRIRVGDMLRINNDTHSVVVLEKKANSVVVTEGNFNSSIHWDREISRQDLEKGGCSVQTRYPV